LELLWFDDRTYKDIFQATNYITEDVTSKQ